MIRLVTYVWISLSTVASVWGQTYYYMNLANNGATINIPCPAGNKIFSDDGPTSSNYSNSIDYTITFCAAGNNLLKFDFGCSDTYTNERLAPGDTLFIYNGSSTSSPLLYAVTGNGANGNLIPYFKSSYDESFVSPSSCITFRFKTNASGNDDGFEACISCVAPVSCGSVNPPASDLFGGAPLVCNLNGYCGVTSGNFGADMPYNLNPSGGTCPSTLNFLGTIENNSWIKFVASDVNASFNFNVPLGGGCTNGIQTAIFALNGSALTRVSDCALSDNSHSGNFTLANTSPLTVGQTYYIMIDGNAGDVCNYTISANTGVQVVDAGANQAKCLNDQFQFTAVGPTSATYTWYETSNLSSPIGTGQTSPILMPSATTSYTVVATGACTNAQDAVQAIVNPCVLPVELIEFKTNCEHQSLVLNWSTASEDQNAYFTVQRADERMIFQELARITAAGNSNALTQYAWVDENPQEGMSYYRLFQTDFDGTVKELSTISAINTCKDEIQFHTTFNKEMNSIQVNYHVNRDEFVDVYLYDGVGNVVLQEQVLCKKENNKVNIPMHVQHTEGVYLVRCLGNSVSVSEKLFLNK